MAAAIFAVFPRYPYRAGHYPKADWYYQLPPYAAIDPSFYRRRFFMMAQERDRYRYMPHIFRGYSDGDQIEDIDIQAVGGSLSVTSYGNEHQCRCWLGADRCGKPKSRTRA